MGSNIFKEFILNRHIITPMLQITYEILSTEIDGKCMRITTHNPSEIRPFINEGVLYIGAEYNGKRIVEISEYKEGRDCGHSATE